MLTIVIVSQDVAVDNPFTNRVFTSPSATIVYSGDSPFLRPQVHVIPNSWSIRVSNINWVLWLLRYLVTKPVHRSSLSLWTRGIPGQISSISAWTRIVLDRGWWSDTRFRQSSPFEASPSKGWPTDEHTVVKYLCREETEIEGLRCNG
jgi:hypothetical protein